MKREITGENEFVRSIFSRVTLHKEKSLKIHGRNTILVVED